MANTIGRRAYSERSGRIIPNVLPNILLVDSNIQDAGFLAFISKLKSRRTQQEKVTWDTDVFNPTTDTVDGAISGTTQTTIKVDNPTYFIPGELWQNKRTGEVYGVSEVNTSTQVITVTRAISALNSSGGTAAAAINDADQLNKIASYVSENSSRQTTKTTTPSEVFNYCQIQRMDLSLSERQIKREFDNDNELSYQSSKLLKEFRMDTDRMFLFGERARFTNSDGDDVTLMNGIRPVVTTNVFNVGGTLFKSQLDEFLVEQGMRFGSRNKVLFASTDVILAFTQIVDTDLTTHVDLSSKVGVTIGTTVLKYTAPNGSEMLIMEDRNISEQHNGEAYGVDMSQLEMRDFSNNGRSGAMHLIKGTQDPDDPGTVDTLMSDQCLTYGIEKTHFKLTNVSGGSYSIPSV